MTTENDIYPTVKNSLEKIKGVITFTWSQWESDYAER